MESWDEVNDALKEMARLRVKVNAAEAKMNERINAAKETAAHVTDHWLRRYAELEEAVESYCKANKAEFARRRTKSLFFGEVRYRVSTKIMLMSGAEAVLEALRKLGLTQYIRTKEEVDKDAMKALDDNTLAKVGACRATTDTITVEPDLMKVEEVGA